jgi:hypothetical protein
VDPFLFLHKVFYFLLSLIPEVGATLDKPFAAVNIFYLSISASSKKMNNLFKVDIDEGMYWKAISG